MNRAPVSSFRRRRAATPSESTPVPAATSGSELFSLVDEDDEVSPQDEDLRPRKRKVVDVGGGGGPRGRRISKG